MSFPFCNRSKNARLGRWWLGLVLLSALALSGCAHWGHRNEGTHDDVLRRDELSEPARQVRVKGSPTRGKKTADDPWMSDEANQVYHNMD
jgi:hypothetical protein